MLTGALRQLFAVAESYPDLKASTNFLDLQRQLSETEDRIAAGRRFYNAQRAGAEHAGEAFPSSLIASVFGFKAGRVLRGRRPGGARRPDSQLLGLAARPARSAVVDRRCVGAAARPDRDDRHEHAGDQDQLDVVAR